MKRLSNSSHDFTSSPAKENANFLISAARLIEMAKDETEIDDNFLKIFTKYIQFFISMGYFLMNSIS